MVFYLLCHLIFFLSEEGHLFLISSSWPSFCFSSAVKSGASELLPVALTWFINTAGLKAGTGIRIASVLNCTYTLLNRSGSVIICSLIVFSTKASRWALSNSTIRIAAFKRKAHSAFSLKTTQQFVPGTKNWFWFVTRRKGTQMKHLLSNISKEITQTVSLYITFFSCSTQLSMNFVLLLWI